MAALIFVRFLSLSTPSSNQGRKNGSLGEIIAEVDGIVVQHFAKRERWLRPFRDKRRIMIRS